MTFSDTGTAFQNSQYETKDNFALWQRVPEWVKLGAIGAAQCGTAVALVVAAWKAGMVMAATGPWGIAGGIVLVGLAGGYAGVACKEWFDAMADPGEWYGCWEMADGWGWNGATPDIITPGLCEGEGLSTNSARAAGPGDLIMVETDSEGSGWNGEILDVLNGVATFETHIGIRAAVFAVQGYVTPNPTGWVENQDAWNHTHADGIENAYAAYQAFNTVNGAADASLKLRIPLVEAVVGDAHEVLIQIGTLPGVGTVYASLEDNGIFIGCKTACSDHALVEVTSPGTATFSPGDGVIKVEFAGDEGEASILLAGTVELKGFTLDAHNEAAVEDRTGSDG